MSRRPNVILVVTDDQGYGDLGCYGNSVLQTPNLDALYAQSVRLEDYHVDPMCAPTRAALMTGRYAARTGVWSTLMGRYIMRRGEVTMGDVFSASGCSIWRTTLERQRIWRVIRRLKRLWVNSGICLQRKALLRPSVRCERKINRGAIGRLQKARAHYTTGLRTAGLSRRMRRCMGMKT